MENMKLFCVSLGCDKNLVDTEKMLGLLGGTGFTFTDDEMEADVILVNTCCFIGDAKEESVNTILEVRRDLCSVSLVRFCLYTTKLPQSRCRKRCLLRQFGFTGKLLGQYRTKSPDALCAVLP